VNSNELRAAIFDALQEVAPEADLSRLGEDTDIRDELDLDSMDFLNFIIGVHERTGIDVPESDYRQLGTLRAALAYLTARG
jgi:acyl carrier protein